jgi:hypothetical protein
MPRLLTLTGAAALAVLLADAAHAQMTGPVRNTAQDDSVYWNMWPGFGGSRTESTGRDAEIEQKYRETLKTKIPDKKPSNDPWRTVRQTPAATPSAATRHKVE